MKRNIKQTFEIVNQVLLTDKISRSNDMRLIRLTYEKMGVPTNLYDLETMSVPSFETITRCRRIAQLRNPFLASQKNIRKNLEVEYKKALKEI